MHEDIIITCYKHGNFQQRASHHIDGSGCPTCKSSKAEKLIGQMLSDANILFNREYLFGGCYGFGTVDMPFDFYIHELNLAIEYDGEFHYLPIYGEEGLERQKFRDSRKDDFCKNKSINLLRIPYWDFKNIEQILLNEVINHA
jgi:very-short-patch-repair endonuclease